MQYDCAVCLKPLDPDDAGTIAVVGATKDEPDNWVWGPYPVHDTPCKDRLAHPELQQLLEDDSHTRTSSRLDPAAPQTEAVLEHWQTLMPSPFFGRRSMRYWTNTLSGSEGLRAQTPWPGMDAVARLRAGRLICLGARSRSREAQTGYDIAVHNAARGMRVIMFAPDLTPRNPLPGLTVYRDARLTPERIRERLEDTAARDKRAELVVIDRLQIMTARDEDPLRLSTFEQVEEVSISLKQTAIDLNTPHSVRNLPGCASRSNCAGPGSGPRTTGRRRVPAATPNGTCLCRSQGCWGVLEAVGCPVPVRGGWCQ